ncbi:arylamine N-acetyltransferase family protein [Bacillus piscicola]|uniref:arylamine N-acetyltransferase family protein n=1 Tax=Bacillus piscicola TaxID=1632684 RepID=UPI001F08AC10|nr:arylamine N-acetyltransferase [Bacillus piscicola]
MSDRLNTFLSEIGVSAKEDKLESITKVLEATADRFPFENVDVVMRDKEKVTEDFLIKKHLIQNRGGLCYELNPLVYLCLKKLGIDVHLALGTVYHEDGWATDKTHVLNVVDIEGELYVADAGFGNNLSRKPLVVDGPPEESSAGIFRVRLKNTEKGNAVLETKGTTDWQLRYAFSTEPADWSELDRIKFIITDDDRSAFNKQLLLSKCLPEKTISINEQRLRIRHLLQKDETDTVFQSEEDLLYTVRQHANPAIAEETKKYLKRQTYFN